MHVDRQCSSAGSQNRVVQSAASCEDSPENNTDEHYQTPPDKVTRVLWQGRICSSLQHDTPAHCQQCRLQEEDRDVELSMHSMHSAQGAP
jgi:hypothetical protein